MNAKALSDVPALPYLGIDMSKDTFHVCLRKLDRQLYRQHFDNNSSGFAKLQAWLVQQHAPRTIAGLEATGCYSLALLRFLHDQQHWVCQLNPRHTSDYAGSEGRRVKTDRVDAEVIANCLAGKSKLQRWHPIAEQSAVLQALVHRRQQLLQDLNAEQNRLEDKLLPALVRRDILSHVRQLKVHVDKATQELERHVLRHTELQKQVQLLCSIPGVGLQVAATLLAEVPLMTTFGRARRVASYAGLTPALAQSGTSVNRRGHMTREGSSLLRKMLYLAALQTTRSRSVLYPVYQAFRARGKSGKCALVAMMHKILRIAYGVLKHETPFAPSLARL